MIDDISILLQNFSSKFSSETLTPFHASENTRIITKVLPSQISGLLRLDETFILDKSVTETTREGYYIVILFNKELKSIYLCLSVGWTQFEDEYGIKEGKQQINAICNHYAKLLETRPSNFREGMIDLNAQNTLGKGYEAGSIISKEYQIDTLNKSVLISDIRELLISYQELKEIVGDSILNLDIDTSNYIRTVKDFKKEVAKESFSKNIDESLAKLVKAANEAPPEVRERLRKEIVRNKKFSKYVKERANHICEICGRPPFFQKNGKPYAEADHIVPLGGKTGGLDSPDNMRCLCPLCHAIITNGSDEEILKLGL